MSWLVSDAPELVVVTGAAAGTAEWDPESRLDLSAYAPALGPGGQPGLPLSLGLGALLLDQAGLLRAPDPARRLDAEPPAACAALGKRLADTAPRAALLAVGDGSARRSTTAPGYLDERAIPFDTGIEQAVRDGDLAALAATDPGLARDLMATGRPAWQVLAGAFGTGRQLPRSCTRTGHSAWPTWWPRSRPPEFRAGPTSGLAGPELDGRRASIIRPKSGPSGPSGPWASASGSSVPLTRPPWSARPVAASQAGRPVRERHRRGDPENRTDSPPGIRSAHGPAHDAAPHRPAWEPAPTH